MGSNSEVKIPIVDCSKIIGPFGSVNDEELKKIALEFGNAMSGIGFAYLINHGVNLNKLENLYKVSKEFFELPFEIKKKYRKTNPEEKFHGYSGPGDELLNEVKNSTELRELLDIWGPHAHKEEDFPLEAPGLKQACDELRGECNNLAMKLLRCLGIYLNLDDQDFFVKNHSGIADPNVRNQTHFRSMYYYPLESTYGIPQNAIRCGEHSDWGTITLLFQDMIGGLEVKRTNGEWIMATPVEGSVIINSGLLLEHWTAGRLSAAPHRVRILNDEKFLKNPRQSCIYFVNPNGDTEVNTILPILPNKPEFANRPTVNAYDHYVRLIAAVYK